MRPSDQFPKVGLKVNGVSEGGQAKNFAYHHRPHERCTDATFLAAHALQPWVRAACAAMELSRIV